MPSSLLRSILILVALLAACVPTASAAERREAGRGRRSQSTGSAARSTLRGPPGVTRHRRPPSRAGSPARSVRASRSPAPSDPCERDSAACVAAHTPPPR